MQKRLFSTNYCLNKLKAFNGKHLNALSTVKLEIIINEYLKLLMNACNTKLLKNDINTFYKQEYFIKQAKQQ